jgi:hypothetical protein
MVGVIGAILIASAVSDSLGDVRAWTLVAVVAVGYMLSRGLAKSGTKYVGGRRPVQPRQVGTSASAFVPGRFRHKRRARDLQHGRCCVIRRPCRRRRAGNRCRRILRLVRPSPTKTKGSTRSQVLASCD